jgi:DNA polymerase (family 10)
MTNTEIAERFRRLADLMELRGDERFRIRSYREAAENISAWLTPLSKIGADDGVKGLQAIPGVGKAISTKIMDLLTTGTFPAWERLTTETPVSVLELLEVPGIGIKLAAQLYKRFKVASREDLRQFAAGGGLEMVDGLSAASAKAIIAALQMDTRSESAPLLGSAGGR